ncbi:MAG TPA: alpha-L-arabinofuranosidase C-terminal domain-containing protein [Verrucomicrobiae bacterium]|jgi:alpha-N-arabinofuranosidase|nr:alpha-L-arabinofuranosidase C-terminal domain-containing protein [Verrucomicrobiae bacterium]
MKTRLSFVLASAAAMLMAAVPLPAADLQLTIDVNQITGSVSPLHYGLMTEEINHSYDGGLYAELVQNRSFLDNDSTPVHWSLVQGTGAVATMRLAHGEGLNDVLTNGLRLDAVTVSDESRAGVANEGYWGMPIRPHTKYHASFFARAADGFTGPVTVSLESRDGLTLYAEGKVAHIGAGWKSYAVTLQTGDTAPTTDARLVLAVHKPGAIWFDLVSLFPPTWHDRPNGNRIDIMQKLADMKPSFLRFPGGNYVEGDTVETRFDWKKTVGPLDHRPGHQCPWGYRSSDGLGLLEFLEWCEDLHMQPVLAVYAGYNLKGHHIDAGPALEPYVQDALDEIEYVTGDSSAKWGRARAKDGHRAPFPLTYVEIGNEDWFDKSGSYDARFAQFYDAIKAKYPHLKCISTVGTEHAVEQRVHSRHPEVLDEHYYDSAATFERVSPTKFEAYDRHGPEIFVGEWAAYEDTKPWESPSRKLPPTPVLKAALADAAWMAGMERNSDLIVMECYAPLFVNVNPGARQWRPNLIGYDALNSYGSPSYYAIQMFSAHHGDAILKGAANDPAFSYSATKNRQTGEVFLKLVNPHAEAQPLSIALQGLAVDPAGTALTLAGTALENANSIDNREAIHPVATPLAGLKPTFAYTLPPYSITILQLKTR